MQRSRSLCALCFPFVARLLSVSRSSLVSVTIYFFIFNPPEVIMKEYRLFFLRHFKIDMTVAKVSVT